MVYGIGDKTIAAAVQTDYSSSIFIGLYIQPRKRTVLQMIILPENAVHNLVIYRNEYLIRATVTYTYSP